ncbi:hypothetical protein GUITHDRAFT_162181 [Guillardia theta CCMP2712]|uniref:Aquaporin n=1 Tax=Guillardia theta (strain CCMP2712) TaxID=905079 RepID=L1JMY4_GUITC|nr:hypothetical protein GUITHDRAFT_162181 [Guillardia theta CCMP2712]EKX49438.1 hypothetical protein GUITHDRAFT_162181 [Guillardia theta CCMP2712]|eukprot:XP_005836418.1 hypothetical protein GUITHDRAFT_162181 [Guillardia theta CCMP2712]
MDRLQSAFGKIPIYCFLAECVGVALFAFFGGGCSANSVNSGLPTAALGNGFCLGILIYATAGISGGHLNPAVSTAFLMTNRLGKQRYLLYITAQLLGAVLGAFLLRIALPPEFLSTPFTTSGSLTTAFPTQVFLLEFICSFLLVYTVFACAVDKHGSAMNAAPLAIGLSCAAGIFAEGPYTGGSMNPARMIGAAVVFWDFTHMILYVVSSIAGGACAGVVYNSLYLEDQPAEPEDRDEEEELFEPSK